MDCKATVNIGDDARGGKTRANHHASDLDMGCTEKYIPCGIVDEDSGVLHIRFGSSYKMNQLELNEYKQGVADSYDLRSQSYDNSEWHVQICHHLLEYSQVSAGQTVLDIGTGTGHLAIASAQVVGDRGQVIGIDISAGMLKQAQSKIDALGLNNVEFQLADAEALDYPIHHFDHILSANTFPWMEDKEATLLLWYQFLKPGGRINIHTPADTAYVGAVILRRVFTKYGISLEASGLSRLF